MYTISQKITYQQLLEYHKKILPNLKEGEQYKSRIVSIHDFIFNDISSGLSNHYNQLNNKFNQLTPNLQLEYDHLLLNKMDFLKDFLETFDSSLTSPLSIVKQNKNEDISNELNNFVKQSQKESSKYKKNIPYYSQYYKGIFRNTLNMYRDKLNEELQKYEISFNKDDELDYEKILIKPLYSEYEKFFRHFTFFSSKGSLKSYKYDFFATLTIIETNGDRNLKIFYELYVSLIKGLYIYFIWAHIKNQQNHLPNDSYKRKKCIHELNKYFKISNQSDFKQIFKIDDSLIYLPLIFLHMDGIIDERQLRNLCFDVKTHNRERLDKQIQNMINAISALAEFPDFFNKL